jgi:hypothetical protein
MVSVGLEALPLECFCSNTQVPEGALGIYQHTDRFRQQIGSLDLMVSLYNKLRRTTLPVEWPLVSTKLEAVGELFAESLYHHDVAVLAERMCSLS